MNQWVVVYRVMWGALAVLVGIGLICIFVPKWQRTRELQRQKSALRAENERTAALTRDLMTKQERFRSDPAFVERVARETGMVKEDEIVFQFANEPLSASNSPSP